MGNKPSFAKTIILQALIWTGLTITVFLLLLPILPVPFAAIRSIAVAFMVATVHYCNQYIFNRTYAREQKAQYFLYAVLMILLLSAGRYVLESFVFPHETQPRYFQENPFRPAFFILTALIVTFVSGILLYVGYLGDKEKALLQTINSHNEARLQYLYSQINPHFLFNSLNNIYSLVLTKNEKAPDTLLMLTDLLHYSVYQKSRGRVALAEEAKQIEILIQLYSLRRDEPYNIELNYEGASGVIEPMILIPLAENCLKHCDFDLNPAAYIKMKLSTTAQELLFETENTFSPQQSKSAGGGVGLQNIRERLQLIYGENQTLQVNQQEGIFKVKLSMRWKE